MTDGQFIYTVKAFTNQPEGGNAAAVVPDASGLTDEQMQAIAKKMDFSETAFVLPPTVTGAEFRLRWFTPTVEVPLCGHATVATLKVLAEEGRIPVDDSALKIDTLSGALRVSVIKDEDRQLHRLQIPVPTFKKITIAEDKAKTLFGLYQSDMMFVWPLVTSAEGPFVPVMSVGTLRKLRPDFERMKHDPDYGAICFFTGETLEVGNTWHCRFFAPGMGINEDPVTGAVNGPLGAYYYQFCDTVKPPRVEYIGEQGDIIGQSGRVYVTVTGDGEKATDIEIGGEAVIVGKQSLDDVLRLAIT